MAWTLLSVKAELFPSWLYVCGARSGEPLEEQEVDGVEVSALSGICIAEYWLVWLPPGCP